MALPNLATSTDLSNRGVDVSNATLVATMLAAASAAIRDAAGCAISQETSTIDLMAPDGQWLVLPVQPVTAVASVAIDGAAVSDWKFLSGRLWRGCGWTYHSTGAWHGYCAPAVVTVTLTHGLAVVPEDIVNLACMFAAAGMAEAAQGAGSHAGVVSESIDDYSVQYAQGTAATATAIEVPERTAQMLRARFGGGVYVSGEQK